MFALRGEEDDNRVEEADEGEGRDALDEDSIVPVRVDECSEAESSEDGGAEGDAEKDGNAGGDDGVVDVRGSVFIADDLDEEDGHGSVEDHLEDGVDGDEDGAVFCVAAGETIPDEDLKEHY